MDPQLNCSGDRTVALASDANRHARVANLLYSMFVSLSVDD